MRAATIPNVLTVLRLVAAPWIAWAILDGAYWTAVAVLALAGATDALDGYLARRLRATSRAGAYLDPISDKILISVVYVCLAWAGDVPWWLVALVFGRDLLILAAAGAIRARTGIRDFPPSVWGKLATLIHIVTVGTVMLARASQTVWAQEPISVLIWVAGTATVWSGIDYAVRGARLVRGALGAGVDD
jgi:cardiolipin synthase